MLVQKDSTVLKDASQFWLRYAELMPKDLPVLITTNINQSTLSTWRKKKIYPRADDACKIARSLNTTVEYLVTGKNLFISDYLLAAIDIARIDDNLSKEDFNILKHVVTDLEKKYCMVKTM